MRSISTIKDIFSTYNGAFAALKNDGLLLGVIPMLSNSASVSNIFRKRCRPGFHEYAFAALKSDGSVVSWGSGYGGENKVIIDRCHAHVANNMLSLPSWMMAQLGLGE